MEKDTKESTKFVLEAFNNAKKIIVGKSDDGKDITYFDAMISQRIEGPKNSGSSYNMTEEELINTLKSIDYVEVEHPDVQEGCKCFKTDLKGLVGIIDIENLTDDTKFWAIDPKNTGKISVGASNVSKVQADESYVIVSQEEINEEKQWVVATFHPGEPVRPSLITTDQIKDGQLLTKEDIEKCGFSKVKYMSDEMTKEYRNKYYTNVLKDAGMDDFSDQKRLMTINGIMKYNKEVNDHDKELVEALANSNINKSTIKKFIDENPDEVYTISECYKNDPELIEYISDKMLVCPNISENSEVFKKNQNLKEKIMIKMKGYSESSSFKEFFMEKGEKKYKLSCRTSTDGLFMQGFENSYVSEIDEFKDIQFPIVEGEDNTNFFLEKNIVRSEEGIDVEYNSKYFEYEEYSSEIDNDIAYADVNVKLENFKGAKEAYQKELEEEERKKEERRRKEEAIRKEEEERKREQAIKDNKFRSISDLKKFVKFKINQFKEKQVRTKDEEREI